MTYLSTHSVLGIHSLLLVCLLTGYASPHGDRTTRGFQTVVALINIHGERKHVTIQIQNPRRQHLVSPSWIIQKKKIILFRLKCPHMEVNSLLPNFLASETMKLWLEPRWCYFRYLTFFPKADEVLGDFRDDVAVGVSYGAGANVWLGVKHLLTKLLQLRVVTVKEQMPSQLFRTLHRAETTVSPQAVSVSLVKRVCFGYIFHVHNETFKATKVR